MRHGRLCLAPQSSPRRRSAMHDLAEPLASHSDADDRPVADRVAALDWAGIDAALDADGYSLIGPLLTAAECAGLSAGFETDAAFRNRVVMVRHGYGRGEYRY